VNAHAPILGGAEPPRPWRRVALASRWMLAPLIAGLALSSQPASAKTAPVACASVTVPVAITHSTPFRATDVAVEGVTCAYARTIFLPDITKPGAGPPSGWKIKFSTVAGNLKQDTCTHKSEVIRFRFTLG
jgi:hypothetical protein